jgi:hypothetical protein
MVFQFSIEWKSGLPWFSGFPSSGSLGIHGFPVFHRVEVWTSTFAYMYDRFVIKIFQVFQTSTEWKSGIQKIDLL